MVKKIAIVIVVVLIAIQFYPVSRTNPEITLEVAANVEAKKILQRSCYDCHSNETVWPWYSYVAPVSWLVADDVKHARKHMNFSEWDKYNPEQQKHKLEEVVEEVEEGAMPIKKYLFIHPDAKVSEKDFAILKEWAESMTSPGTNEESNDEFE